MADNNQDIEMADQQEGNNRDEEMKDESTNQESILDAEEVKKNLIHYKIKVLKNDDSEINTIVKDIRITLDRIDSGKLPITLDETISQFISCWSERKFYKVQAHIQAVVNGLFQYWMYKRINKKHFNKENFKILSAILNDDNAYYTVDSGKDTLNATEEEIEDVRQTNPILYTHIDDFTEVRRKAYSPFYVDNVNSFCKLDGFAELINSLDNQAEDFTIIELRSYLTICINTGAYLKKDFKGQIFTTLIDKILNIIRAYPDEKLKTIDQSELEMFINSCEYVLEGVYENDKKIADEIVQNFELELALRFLHTPYIEKRVNGLNILISKVNLVNRSSFQ